jgi:nucleoside-diphosphate-sugar epimerase
MKAIVTGGAGFIGHNLCQQLMKNDWSRWTVCAVDDLSSGKAWNQVEGVKYYYEPIENVIDGLVQDFKPDVIFHLAAIPRVAYSVEYPYETTQANVMSTLALLEAVRKYKKYHTRIIFSSSSSVYGDVKALPTPISSPPNPQSPYALQKWQGEQWCKLYSSLYGLDTVSLRYFNVIGRHSYYGGAYSTVLSAWLHHLYVDPTSVPFLEGDGTQTRDFCGVENVVQANMLAAIYNQDNFHGEVFNVAQGASHSLLDCKRVLEQISGKTLNLEMRPPRKGDVKHTLADILVTKNLLGYRPDVNFERQVSDMADWYKHEYRTN